MAEFRQVFATLAVAVLTFTVSSSAQATIYHGFPHLHLTMAVVDAGGGASKFDSRRLMRQLAQGRADAQTSDLIHRYGPAKVDAYYDVFTFAIMDALKRAHNYLIPLPRSAQPNPADGRAVAVALYDAGLTPSGRFDVGYMLEVLVSHQIHHDIMGDMDRTFTPPVNAEFHVILTRAMNDLHREYAAAGVARNS